MLVEEPKRCGVQAADNLHRGDAVMDMARLEDLRCEVTRSRERVRQRNDRLERVGWMVRCSQR